MSCQYKVFSPAPSIRSSRDFFVTTAVRGAFSTELTRRARLAGLLGLLSFIDDKRYEAWQKRLSFLPARRPASERG